MSIILVAFLVGVVLLCAINVIIASGGFMFKSLSLGSKCCVIAAYASVVIAGLLSLYVQLNMGWL